MAQHNSTTTTRYVCRFCGSAMMPYATPAGEPCYECCNRACRFTAMVGAECSMNVAPQAPVPTPIAPVARTARQKASDKAAYYLASGVRIVATHDAWLVPSGTRGGIIHRVNTAMQCSCEAGLNGRSCWHVEAVELLESAQLAA